MNPIKPSSWKAANHFEATGKEREREILYFKFGFVSANRGGRIHLIESSYAPLRHFVLSMQSSFFNPILSIRSSTSLFHVIFGRPRPLVPTIPKSNALRNTSSLSLLKTYQFHRTPRALASPSKVSSKPSKLISSWLLLFSINLFPLIHFTNHLTKLIQPPHSIPPPPHYTTFTSQPTT